MKNFKFEIQTLLVLFIFFLGTDLEAQSQDPGMNRWKYSLGLTGAIDMPLKSGLSAGIHSTVYYKQSPGMSWLIKMSGVRPFVSKALTISGDFKYQNSSTFQAQILLGCQFNIWNRDAQLARSPWSLSFQCASGYSISKSIFEIWDYDRLHPEYHYEKFENTYNFMLFTGGPVLSYSLGSSKIYLEVLPQMSLLGRETSTTLEVETSRSNYPGLTYSKTGVGVEFSGLMINLGYQF